MTLAVNPELSERLIACVDERRLVETACAYVSTPSPTGSEHAMAETVSAALEDTGVGVSWQEVEDGRPNVIGTLEGAGGGPTLMFNGHMDTSYSGREPHLRGILGFQPQAVVKDGRIYGLGISNMKGALACYLEAVRAVRDAGITLRGDVLIACVVGEIEKTQWGEEFRGPEYRGYAAGSRYLPTHGGIADMCILGEPTEQRVVLGHFGTMWARISTHGPFVHTAFSSGRLQENSIVRMREVMDDVLAWIPGWERRARYRGREGVVNIGSLRGGHPWRVSRTPDRTDLFLDVRVPPTMPMQGAKRELAALVRELRSRHPDYGIEYEVFVTAPGAEIDEGHALIRAIDAGHERVFGQRPERDVVRWFSDASALTRYGIATVNYGTSSGLPGPDGENLDIEGLRRIAAVYALAVAELCEVAS
ncbi:MAG: M20/M25/M40 family metallo-hydrolase [Solirubrobacterales bacterium]|nr:M20/M25/M40 family metallo-hydrolase [Solirubrobacterales bacterium]MBV9715443.1 M20/M25/M40 family metallo-hydrolase [Solirubrobacterales bacterium]